jgi:hypothetical protein
MQEENSTQPVSEQGRVTNEQAKPDDQPPVAEPARDAADAASRPATGKKERTREVNIDMQNSSVGHGSNQENNVQIAMQDKLARGNLNFNVLQKSIHQNEELELNFSELSLGAYYEKVSENAQSYIRACVPDVVRQLQTSRVVVINHQEAEAGVELAALDSIASGSGFKHDSKWLSCTIAPKNASVELIIKHFGRFKSARQKGVRKGVDKVLVIYEKNDPSTIILSDFLASVLESDGITDAVAASLRSAGLYILYVCNNRELLKIPARRVHASLWSITDLRMWLFAKHASLANLKEIVALTEAALYDTGWLSKSSLSEQKKEIESMLDEGLLKAKMEERLNVTDSEYRTKVIELARQPLNNIVLYCTVYYCLFRRYPS